MAHEPSVVVFGAGAVGGYIGGRLAAVVPARTAVTLLGRPATMTAIAERGLTLRDLDGDVVTHPRVADSARKLGPVDLVLLTVRTYDVAATIPDLLALLGERGLLVAFQNGVGTEEVLAHALGRQRVLPATLTVSAGMEQPGTITRYSRSGGIALSAMEHLPVPSWIVELFAATGLPTVTMGDYRQLRWSKLLVNMLGAATSAIVDIDMTALLANKQLFRIEQLAFREAVRVMQCDGIKTVALPGFAVPQAQIAMRTPRALAQRTLGTRIARARDGRSPGMRADMARGKSEIEAFNGAVAAAGQRLGIRTPVNVALTHLVRELLAHPEKTERYRGRPDQLVAYMARQGITV